jgi:hypothetical protein
MQTVLEMKRPGSIKVCSRCQSEIKYSFLVNWEAPQPFFYGERCNDILVRRSDYERVPEGDAADPEYVSQLVGLWDEIVATAPRCPCGGRFGLWSYIKCPRCHYEFQYNKGARNAALRIFERHIIVVDGARIIGDGSDDSWTARAVLPSEI